MKLTTTKEIGDFGERIAARYLIRHGYFIRARNWRAGKDELDIVATTLRDVVFIEVKTRSYSEKEIDTAPPPGCAVHTQKQKHTRACAAQYLREHPTRKQPRMDVIEIWLSKEPNGKRPRLLRLHHIKAAY